MESLRDPQRIKDLKKWNSWASECCSDCLKRGACCQQHPAGKLCLHCGWSGPATEPAKNAHD